MGKVFTTQRRVEFRDTDASGIVHFSAYLCYMEQAEHEFLRSVGLSVLQPHPSCGYISWPRVKAECSYAAPARFEELLSITLRIARLGSKSVTYQFEFRSGQDNVVANGNIVVVCCHIKDYGNSIVSVEIPDSHRTILAQYLNCDSN